MSYDSMSEGGLDYFPCRYGASRNLFRGPKRMIEPPFVTTLGGTETYGRFIQTPYPNRLESALERPVINLGANNGSADLYLHDTPLIDLTNMAQLTVFQITGAHNMNNRFYTVHPRRNDRFIRASALLRSVYREVDFTEFHYTKHLLHSLAKLSEDRFRLVVDELRQSWVARMTLLLRKINSPVLLMLLTRMPLPKDDALPENWLDHDPLFVTQTMVRALMPHISQFLEIIPPADLLEPDLDNMIYSELEAPAAASVMPPGVHHHVAEMLLPKMSPYLHE